MPSVTGDGAVAIGFSFTECEIDPGNNIMDFPFQNVDLLHLDPYMLVSCKLKTQTVVIQ